MKKHLIIFFALVFALALFMTSCEEALDDTEDKNGMTDTENDIVDDNQSPDSDKNDNDEKLPENENEENHEHTYNSAYSEQAPSCFEEGFIIRECSCGEIQKEILPAFGKHTECVEKGNPPTCIGEGYTDLIYCSVCGTVLEEQTAIEPLGHLYVLYSNGSNDYHTVECTTCDEAYDDEHSYDENNSCTVCNHTLSASEMIVYERSSDGKTAKMVRYNGSEMYVKIADTYEGLPVTEICEFAFYNATLLKTVVIPDSVTYIGDEAFVGCCILTSATLPESLVSIGEWAFNCTGLTSIEIPANVTNIGNYAFYNCDGLESITIPAATTSIGDCAFGNCNVLKSITVSQSNGFYKTIDGVLYTKDGKTLLQYATGKTDESFIVPNQVNTVYFEAFANCQLTSVTISDNVISVGDFAFSSCPRLTSITIGKGLSEVGIAAFAVNNSLLSITVDGNNEHLISIDGNLYTKDGKTLIQYSIGKSDTSFTIPDTVEIIGKWSFADCKNLVSIVISNNVTSINSYAFLRCENLKSLFFGAQVSRFSWDIFQGCDSLTDIYYPGSEEAWGLIAKFGSNDYLTDATTIHFNYNV